MHAIKTSSFHYKHPTLQSLSLSNYFYRAAIRTSSPERVLYGTFSLSTIETFVTYRVV